MNSLVSQIFMNRLVSQLIVSVVSGIILLFLNQKAIKAAEQRAEKNEMLRLKRNFYYEFMGARMYLNNNTGDENDKKWKEIANKIPAVFEEDSVIENYRNLLKNPDDTELIIDLYESIFKASFSNSDGNFDRDMVRSYLS
ncbi:hypothetical protein LIX87_02685 [Weissella viridescens]|uniref:hypothetical protein n=1 Tax=Weissella viridescens TaxID=1629 RepID=UPI001D092697|nr:hypothetical protein [Weissella viridescens]MCB6839927.1 hypothetical protein [Weissella viridescens]MCB6846659.1 hypothetical protein [Weissella viridescens]